ncbi:helix-turn-helix domain-containing protein [Pelosinus propionicus]|uniref:DNA binding domain-containing protein, excisionase family n=1 Tax=Pelosinus propionicus DSM 13327 TaxID=1123291 RepID=A0A1I4JHT6_9FIRM|nr:helix-turn-helix domain-containing protein [Pelosinus propionicus]SFL65841.1 DNA binding domain-containing protein, excisionase family [Pelosinus propionicus DSM 13327]SFM24709.1 DNA binding domain-containing protein, excisionase family [Pelosinus propionicus DSM 13327]
METKQSPLMTVKETAEYLRFSKETIYRLIASNDIPALKIGRSWKIHKFELEELIEWELKNKTIKQCY